jgi:hypothetical protein
MSGGFGHSRVRGTVNIDHVKAAIVRSARSTPWHQSRSARIWAHGAVTLALTFIKIDLAF